MAQTVIVPTGVLLGAGETTVYTAGAGGPSKGYIRFSNVDTVARSLNAFVYTGAGPGADTTRLVPTNFNLPAGMSIRVTFLLSASYKITATSSSANKINAVPYGLETT